MCDQLRADAVQPESSYVSTPNIKAMADQGCWFSQCYTNSPQCVPARVALATGDYPYKSGIVKNCKHTIDNLRPNWMQAIRAAGYETGFFGKAHLHEHHGDLRPYEGWMRDLGFDVVDEILGPRSLRHTKCNLTLAWEKRGLWDLFREDLNERLSECQFMVRPSPLGLDQYYDVYVPQMAKRHLSRLDGKKPFFCVVSFAGPHEPYDTPEPYASLYDPDDMPSAVERPSFADVQNPSFIHKLMSKPNGQNLGVTDDDIAKLRANYAGAVSLIDDQIGKLLQQLKIDGLFDETLIVLTSDHGELNGDYGLLKKAVFLDSSVRIPLVIKLAATMDQRNRGHIDSLVELIDIGPTLAAVSQSSMPFQSEGLSILPLLCGSNVDTRQIAISQFRDETMIVDHRWKAVYKNSGKLSLLFDRVNDPLEIDNLAGQQSAPDLFDNRINHQKRPNHN